MPFKCLKKRVDKSKIQIKELGWTKRVPQTTIPIIGLRTY